ncbi:hypothetical protein SBOR_2767 [Sclerotinia borealis F-4128]|uniref:Stc1 domain-containing protein n=1 Tax=Sclerotinia borealis (strain F-4128) TaxID=1432307 RepID=W9CM10_SCLBF|nr:hypothetical protein SBOR_2767 [Sclerotinia borealis F-4128]
MAFRNNRYAPATDRKGVVIPIDHVIKATYRNVIDDIVYSFKFKCRHCSIFKTQDCFSKNEIAPYKNQLAQNPSMKPNAVAALLRCRGCKGEQVQELQCEGPCGNVKVLDLFSKAQRSRGNKWCMECVHWKEAYHPEVDLAPAPGSELGREVTTNVAPEETTGSSYAASVIALSQKTASLAIGSASNSRNENYSQSSMSNPFEGARSVDTPVDSVVWTTQDSRRIRRVGNPIQYNAYDANGVRHTQKKTMTSTSIATSTIGESSSSSVTCASPAPVAAASRLIATGNRPAAPASPPAAPAAAPQPVRVITNQNTGWAKPIGTRTRQPAAHETITEWAPESNTPHRRSTYDSSDDEM